MKNVKTLFPIRFGITNLKSDPLVQIGYFYCYELLDRILKYFYVFLLVLIKNEQFDSQKIKILFRKRN